MPFWTFAVVTLAMNSGSRKKTPTPATSVRVSIRAIEPLPSSTPLVGGLEAGAPDEPARPHDQRLVEHDEAADEGQLRPARAVDARVEALRGIDDAAVGMAEGDGDRVTAAHQDAFDERLAAVRVARHWGSLPSGALTAHGPIVHRRDLEAVAAERVGRLPGGGRLQSRCLEPQLRGGDVARVDLDPDEAPAHLDRGDTRRADAHERIEHEVARVRSRARADGARRGAASGSGGPGRGRARCRRRSAPR